MEKSRGDTRVDLDCQIGSVRGASMLTPEQL
jgi:hypothetical protein